MVNYDIENVGIDHPALLSGNFEACTIARCRQAGPPPWALDLDCRGLPRYGTTKETCTLTWHGTSEKYADRAEKTYQAPRLTEDGAIGLGASVFAALKEGQITEVALRGTGVDYWIERSAPYSKSVESRTEVQATWRSGTARRGTRSGKDRSIRRAFLATYLWWISVENEPFSAITPDIVLLCLINRPS